MSADRTTSWSVTARNHRKRGEVEEASRRKRLERGGFDKRVYLYEVCSDPAGAVKTGERAGISGPRLLTRESEVTLVEKITEELRDARRLNVASAFYSRSMHNLLIRQLQDFVSREVSCGFSHPS